MSLPRDPAYQPAKQDIVIGVSQQGVDVCDTAEEEDSWAIPPLLTSRPTADADTDKSLDWSNGGSSHKPLVPVRGECQCCFDAILSSSNCVSCTLPEAQIYEGVEHELLCHKFCKDCIRRYVEMWLFGGAVYKIPEYEVSLPCPSGECSHGALSHDAIQECCLLPSHAEVWARYQERVFELVSLKEAAMLGEPTSPRRNSFPPKLERASHYDPLNDPFRKNTAPLDSSSPATNQKTLLDNAKPPKHVKIEKNMLICQPVSPSSRRKNNARRSISETDKDEAQRKQLEETMSAAKIRHCPKCQMAFLKETGCNKLKCPQCGTSMCNVCRQGPVKYDHFCNHRWWNAKHPSCTKCHKCPMWQSKSVEEAQDWKRVTNEATNEAYRLWEESLLSESSHSSFLDEKNSGGESTKGSIQQHQENSKATTTAASTSMDATLDRTLSQLLQKKRRW